jgi:lipoprotein signal peptidase
VIWLLQILLRLNGRFGLFLGGAMANYIHRLPNGRVTECIGADLGAARWPTFNLPDSFIGLGIQLLLLMTYLKQLQLEHEV